MTNEKIISLLAALAESFNDECLENCEECPKKALEEAIDIIRRTSDTDA